MYVNPIVTRESCRSKNIARVLEVEAEEISSHFLFECIYLAGHTRLIYSLSVETSIPIYLLFLIEINVGISNIRPFRNYSILEKIILRIGFKKKGLKDRKNRFENSPISKAGKVKRINRIAKDPSSEQTSPTSTYIDTQGDQCRDVFTRDDV